LTTNTDNDVPGMDVLGYTYNIFGLYASPKATMLAVVQDIVDFNNNDLDDSLLVTQTVDGVSYTYPKICMFQDVSTTRCNTAYGDNYQSFQSAFSSTVGASVEYGAFSASLSSEYSSTTVTTSDRQYYRLVDTYQGVIARFDDTNNLTFTDDFSADLNDGGDDLDSIKSLYQTYGTHLVTGLILGGSVTASYSASTETYSSESEFVNEANAKYNASVGSVRLYTTVTSADSTYQSDVEQDDQIEVKGGTAAAQSALINDQDWDTWAASVSDNLAVVDFLGDDTEGYPGLTPIWELCSDSTRGDTLETAFYELYSPQHTTPVWTKAPNSDGNTSGTYVLGWNVNDDLAGSEYESRIPYMVLTGFGARIDGNDHVTRIAVQVTDLGTGDTYDFVKGDVTTFMQSDYEQYATVPAGCVMTGIALREKDDNLADMTLYYQAVDMTERNTVSVTIDGTITRITGGLLGTNIGSIACGSSAAEQAWVPASGNTSVMTGIQVASSGQAQSFVTLNVYLATLYLEVDQD